MHNAVTGSFPPSHRRRRKVESISRSDALKSSSNEFVWEKDDVRVQIWNVAKKALTILVYLQTRPPGREPNKQASGMQILRSTRIRPQIILPGTSLQKSQQNRPNYEYKWTIAFPIKFLFAWQLHKCHVGNG